MSTPTLRAYLAAPYPARPMLRYYAEDLMHIGIDVVASWLDEEHEINAGTTGSAPGLDPAEVARHAATDLDDIERCDVLVVFTARALGLDPAEVHSGGRHVETGYALAKGTPVIVVGEPENVFHRLDRLHSFVTNEPWVRRTTSWAETIAELNARKVEAEKWHRALPEVPVDQSALVRLHRENGHRRGEEVHEEDSYQGDEQDSLSRLQSAVDAADCDPDAPDAGNRSREKRDVGEPPTAFRTEHQGPQLEEERDHKNGDDLRDGAALVRGEVHGRSVGGAE
jgi:nucleoside 2-deoxyribosyltransferase